MAKTTVEFKLKIPRVGEATMSVAIDSNDAQQGIDANSKITVDDVVKYLQDNVLTKTQVTVTNGRDVVSALRDARKKATAKAA